MQALSVCSLCVLGLQVALNAQTFIVDVHGGAGSSFRDLPEAIAAVPDGARLRVRDGRYTLFTVADKGIAIVGEEGERVEVTQGLGSSLVIERTRFDQPVLLRNLVLADSALAGGIVIREALGAVVLDHVSLDPALPSRGGAVIDVQEAENVQLHDCDWRGSERGSSPTARLRAMDSRVYMGHSHLRGSPGATAFAGVSGEGGTALELLSSRCESVASSFEGGLGGYGCGGFAGCFSQNGAGGLGVLVGWQSTFVALDSAVSGGRGQDQRTHGSGLVLASAGGSGVFVQPLGQAIFEGQTPRGGPAGVGSTQNGESAVVLSGGTLSQNPNARPPIADLLGAQRVGSTIRFRITARPGSVAVWVASRSASRIALEPMLGSFIAPVEFHSGAFSLSTGSHENALTIDASFLLTQTWFAQCVTLEPRTGRLWASNAVPLLVTQ